MSISNFKEPNILFLKGIHREDIISIEDIYQKELLNTVDASSAQILYDKIPKSFTSLTHWKKTTNLRCWFCSLRFKTIPWFIIENITYNTDGKKFDITGNFCSCGCLMGYVKIHYNKRDHFDIYNYVYKLYEIFHKKKKNDIKPSPEKFVLDIYGGNLTIEKYQKEIMRINELNLSD